MTKKTAAIVLGVIGLIAFCVISRMLGHWRLVPPNFAPVAAAALFAGAKFRRRWIAVCVPIAAMLVSDYFIGFYDLRVLAVVYAALLFPILLRSFVQGRGLVLRVGLCSVICSFVFFFATNAAVWFASDVHTMTSLIACYVAALPFFKYMLVGDLFFSALFFGGFALATHAKQFLGHRELPAIFGRPAQSI